MQNYDLSVSAPGRLCIFGEHQDYLGLSIIASAVNLRISVRGRKRKDQKITVSLPDINEQEEFDLKEKLIYKKNRDYLKSAINVLKNEGVHFRSGWDCLIQGKIPINAGTASSSALVVAWIKFLLEATGDLKAKMQDIVAELSFLAEVSEFNEPGGKMDHYASSYGGIVCLSFGEHLKITKFKNPLKEFVLANSLQKKDTTGMLSYIKTHVLQGVTDIQKKIKDFNLRSFLGKKELKEIEKLAPEVRRLLKGTLMTRDLTSEGEALFKTNNFDHDRFGELLSQQHRVLRDYIHISTPKIERMIEASLQAGALGAKINGSGGGGCMFAYSPNNAEKVARAIEKLGADVFIVHIDEGARLEKDLE